MVSRVTELRGRYESSLTTAVGTLLVSSLLLYPAGVLVFWATGLSSPSFFDFSAYYQTGYKLLHGYPIYASPADFPHPPSVPEAFHVGPYGRNLYPPVLSLVYVPFSLAPFELAGWAWATVSVGALFGAVVSLVRSFGLSLSRRHWAVLLWSVVGFYVVKQNVYMGQITLLLTASMTMSASFLYRPETAKRRPLLAAFAALPVFVKPYYAVTLPHLLREYRRVFYAAATIAGLSALSIALFGADTYLRYLHIVVTGTGRETPASIYDWSGGTYRPLYAVREYQNAVRACGVLAVGLFSLVVSRARTRRTERYLFVLGAATLVLFAPGVKDYTLAALVPAILVALREEYVRADGVLVVPLLATLFVHLNKYAVSALLRAADAVPAVGPLVPLLQPALWGSLSLLGLSATRLLEEYRHADRLTLRSRLRHATGELLR